MSPSDIHQSKDVIGNVLHCDANHVPGYVIVRALLSLTRIPSLYLSFSSQKINTLKKEKSRDNIQVPCLSLKLVGHVEFLSRILAFLLGAYQVLLSTAQQRNEGIF